MDLKFLASLDAAIHSQDMTGPLRTFQYVVSGTFERRVLHNAGPIGFKAIDKFENPMSSCWALMVGTINHFGVELGFPKHVCMVDAGFFERVLWLITMGC